jgi:hypothetical protein
VESMAKGEPLDLMDSTSFSVNALVVSCLIIESGVRAKNRKIGRMFTAQLP